MRALFVLLSWLPVPAIAANVDCSIRANHFMSDAEMQSRARMTDEQARVLALRSTGAKGASISGGGLEVEGGCLLYSFDVRLPWHPGFKEVLLDAGTGKVLKIQDESEADELAELAAERDTKSSQ